ncbi:YjgP/YjgQ family permease [bacterium]|nr:MAG: YjgP/YjgQ family permease [bacterium]
MRFPNTIDRFILKRLFFVTVMMLALLIFIFIIIDFSENSDDFTDRGATAAEIWGNYYLHYIPEIVRLVSPVALFVAALLITGQLADRVELISLKSAGVSLYRILVPYLLFGCIGLGIVSYLDGFVVPNSNQKRVGFERTYINRKSDRIDKNKLYRQNTPNSILQVNYFEPTSKIAYNTILFDYSDGKLAKKSEMTRMKFIDSLQIWRMTDLIVTTYDSVGFTTANFAEKDTSLNVLPRDLSRTTADIYMLEYLDIVEYLESIERSGAGGLDLPQVQFYGKLFYALSIPIVMIIGVCVSSVRRKGGKGTYLAIGLGVSFAYLALMKLSEPLGANGVLSPLWASLFPHLFFLFISVIILVKTKK